MSPESDREPDPAADVQNEGQLSDVAAHLDSLAQEAAGLTDLDLGLSSIVRSSGTSAVDRYYSAAYAAIRYRITFVNGRLAFEPHLVMPDDSEPLNLESQPDEIVRAWSELHDRCASPIWRSRFGHLVAFSKRVLGSSDRRALAASAIDDYLAIPNEYGHEYSSVEARRAALSLSRQFGLNDQHDQIVRILEDRARLELSGASPRLGVVLDITRGLIDDGSSSELDALLDTALSVFKADAHQGDAVYRQQLERASTPDKLARLWSDRVDHWLDAADSAPGPQRAIFLTRAVEYATAAQNPALVERATVRLQTVTLDSLQLQGFRTEIIHRAEEVADAVRPIVDAQDWRDAFDSFARLPVPTGKHDLNRENVEQQHREFVLSALLPNIRYGGDGLPRFAVQSPDDKFEYDLAQNETSNMQLGGIFVAEALLRLQQTHGLPPLTEFVEYLSRKQVFSPALSAAVARAFHRWWAGDYEGAAFTITPRIESLARRLLLALQSGIYRLAREERPGQYPGLGFLLAKLHELGVLPIDHFRYLHVLLTSPVGLNLRNEISHGLVDNIDSAMSAILLHAAAFLCIVPDYLEVSGDIAPAAGVTPDAEPADE